MNTQNEVLPQFASGTHGKEEITYFQARDDAMRNVNDPIHSIPNGAWVAVRRWRNINSIWWGEVYAFKTIDGFVMIRRIYPSEKEGYIRLVSENEQEYPTYDIPFKDIMPGSFSVVKGVMYIHMWN